MTDKLHNLKLDALNLNRYVSKKRNLLHNVSISILPHEFVGIVGVNGVGKTTLLHAMSGFHPPSSGTVMLNGLDLYANFNTLRNQIGFVPQRNIIHMELTVYEELDYSARLRLPSGISAAERHNRIIEVMETLDLMHCKDQPIMSLSGGEQKHVSMGVELLTQPKVFFLDEATSGLDPGSELEIMNLLRRLSDQGRSVILVTHYTKNIEKCHFVAILADGGHLAYFGPPHEALDYFGVSDFDEIYLKLREIDPGEAVERYLGSDHYKNYLATRLPEKREDVAPITEQAIYIKSLPKRISSLSQFLILSQRNLNMLFRDKASLVLLCLTPPIIATLDFIFWKKGIFEPKGGDPWLGLFNLYMVAVIAFLVGAILSMREIVKESDIYQRERMLVLKILPYALSKALLAGLIAVCSSLIFLLFLEISGGWPPLEAIPSIFITLVLSILGGAMIGLLISAISPNPNVTPLLLLLVVVPQLLFAGMIPYNKIGPTGNIIGQATTTKWSFDALVKISGMGDGIIADPYWNLPDEKRKSWSENDKKQKCACAGANMFSMCNFPGIKDIYVAEIDDPEPLKPAKVGDPPPHPEDPPSPPYNVDLTHPGEWQADVDIWGDDMNLWQDNVTRYQDNLELYKQKTNKYQSDMEAWKDKYQKWRENRSTAIGKAEGIVDEIYDDYRQVFKASVAASFIALSSLIFIMFLLILLALKMKDRRRASLKQFIIKIWKWIVE